MGLRTKKSPLDQAKEQASSVAEAVLPAIGSAYESARKSAAPVLEEARDRAGTLAEEAREKATELAADVRETALDKAHTLADDARSTAAPYVEDARSKAQPYVKDAKKRAKKARKNADPYVTLASAKAKPYVEGARKNLDEARTKAEPLIAEGKASAAERAAAGASLLAAKAQENSKHADARASALRKEATKARGGGKLKKLLLLGLVAAVGAVVFSKVRGSGQDNWQSSYTPTPPPAPATSPSRDVTGATGTVTSPVAGTAPEDDPGGADAAEALSDSIDRPHPVTDPDHPAESVDVDDKRD